MSAIRATSSDGILRITFDRPARRNALGPEEWDELERLFRAVREDGTQIVTLTGSGTVFCAGVDLAMTEAARAEPGGLLRQVERIGAIVAAIESAPALVVVALNGPAIGIGVHLALAADFVLAREDAWLWLPEAALGVPDVQHQRRLVERLGKHRAFAVALLGERLPASEAHRAGLIGETVGSAEALGPALDGLVGRLMAVPPQVRRALKAAALDDPARGAPAAQAAAVAASEQGI